MVEKSIASFERTVVSGNSPFDRYMYGGDNKALSASAQRGLEVFRNPKKGNCAVCHTIGEKYALFTDNKFHNLGVGVKLGINGEAELTDLGRFKVTNVEADKGAFKTPSLRNIALTAPYMHDGSHKNLKEVIDFYIGGGQFQSLPRQGDSFPGFPDRTGARRPAGISDVVDGGDAAECRPSNIVGPNGVRPGAGSARPGFPAQHHPSCSAPPPPLTRRPSSSEEGR